MKRDSSRTLIAIGIFKLFKAVMLIIVGVGALKLLNRDLPAVAMGWIQRLHFDPNARWLNKLLSALPGVTQRQLELLGVGTFFYAAVYLVEGVGLVCRLRWAEYLALLSTTLPLPLELRELIHHASWLRAALLGANILIAVYLVFNLWRDHVAARKEKPSGA